MNINEDAPAVARASIEVSAPAYVVWDVLADFESWPEWDPVVRSMSLDGPIAEGTQFRWKPGLSTVTSTLRAVERPRAIGWTGKTVGIEAVHVWSLEAEDGKTLVSTAESWDGWLPRLLRGPMRKQLQRGLDSALPTSRPRPNGEPTSSSGKTRGAP